ncbi:hypothetical protein Tco_1257154, partial [Tanacetum coccineum]
EEHADYPADGGDGDDEPSDDDDDDDTDDEDEEPFEDAGDDEEEEEHLDPTDSFATPVVDPVPSAGDTEAFETDESAPIPRLPKIRVPFAQTRLYRAQKTVRLESHLCHHPWRHALLRASLGYRAAGIRMRAAVVSPPLLLPSTSHRTDIPEAEMPPRKRACFATLAPGLEIGESSAAGAARQPGPTLEADTWDEIVEAMLEEAYNDRAYLRARVNTLFRDRPYHRHTAMALDREAIYARIAWTGSEKRSAGIEAHVRTLEAQVATLITQTTSLQT